MGNLGNAGFFEVHIDDFERAQKFYRDVFGWEFSKSSGTPYEFYMIDSSSKGGMGLQEGGMRKREKTLAQESGVSGYVCYIIVDAIDEVLEKLKSKFLRNNSANPHVIKSKYPGKR